MFDYTYPHTNLSDINLDWFLKRFTEIEHEIITIREELTQAQEDISSNTESIEHLQNDLNDLIAAYNSLISDFAQFINNIARPYSNVSTYDVGDYVIYDNVLYKCYTAITSGEAFDPSKWYAVKVMDEIESGGGSYTLPVASADRLGGVKIGEGLSIDTDGVLSANGGGGGGYVLPIASSSTLGGVKIGNGLSIDDQTGILEAIGSDATGFPVKNITIDTSQEGNDNLLLVDTSFTRYLATSHLVFNPNNNAISVSYDNYAIDSITALLNAGKSYIYEIGDLVIMHLAIDYQLVLRDQLSFDLTYEEMGISLPTVKFKAGTQIANYINSLTNKRIINTPTYLECLGNAAGNFDIKNLRYDNDWQFEHRINMLVYYHPLQIGVYIMHTNFDMIGYKQPTIEV